MTWKARILMVLALGGLLFNLFLLHGQLNDVSSQLAGCGGGGCDAVFGSRWGRVLGIPVSAIGAVVYLAMCAALLVNRQSIIAAACACILGAMLWFVFVQALLIRQFCPWCMAVHGLGFVIGVIGLRSLRWDQPVWNGLQTGVFFAFSLALIQLYGPSPAGYQIESPPESVGKKISFKGGHRVYDATSLPRIGAADAPHVIVEYFDYRCQACRRMSGYLDALLEKHPRKVAVLLLPVPLERACNSAMNPADADHSGSCELARLALAVWLAKPESFATFHRTMLAEPAMDVATAKSLGRSILPDPALDKALVLPAISSMLATHVIDWSILSTSTRILPKLIIRDQRVLHGLPSGQEEFIRVMEKELGL